MALRSNKASIGNEYQKYFLGRGGLRRPVRSSDLAIFMWRLPRNYGSLSLLEPYDHFWACNVEFIQVDKPDRHAPGHCFPYHYAYYVIDEIYINQDTLANKLTYTPPGQSRSQAISRWANK